MVAKLARVALRAALLVVVLAAMSRVSFAQSPQCMPGGSCCINGTCGTLEQFKRNATIVCLQADAIENKSLPQSIEWAGRCTAAQMMAGRVEETQLANAKEHRQALEAQRRLREMGAPMPPEDPMVIAKDEMVAAITECRNKRIEGTLKTFVASAECANPRIIEAFSKAKYRYMDLIAAFNAKRLQISERVDREELAEADAQTESQRLFASIVEAERQRDAMRK
ncbi:hypothetical protein ACQR1H_31235 [Bradyrhizobium sp. HKCCYLRH2015]|uniref:hypothetical protein n=1 Tax=Bradyrhizobium sp. HKCCYLRH2015 TaxID=3420742 RepID=UPI003EBC79F2